MRESCWLEMGVRWGGGWGGVGVGRDAKKHGLFVFSTYSDQTRHHPCSHISHSLSVFNSKAPISLTFYSLIAQGKEEILTPLQSSCSRCVESERAVSCCFMRGDFLF